MLEMLLKIFGLGFAFNKKAYLRDYWNIIDFVVVMTSLIPFLSSGKSAINISILR